MIHSRKLLAAIIIFAAIAPGALMTAPAVGAQLAIQWNLSPSRIGMLFSSELGAMSLATLPAWWWISRINWRTIATLASIIFLIGNLASAIIAEYSTSYPLLLTIRFLTSLAGGTLMILCMGCAAHDENPSRIYAFWVLGQLVLGAVALLILPMLFAYFGLMIIYLALAAIICGCLPLLSSFPIGFQPRADSSSTNINASNGQKLYAILSILIFYICLSAVWTFIDRMATNTHLNMLELGQVLSISTVFGIVGAGVASFLRSRKLMIWLGYILLAASLLLLSDNPQVIRFIAGAIIFKFTWTFVLPFLLAHIATLDNNGKLINSINLVIGGGMAIGPTLAGLLIEHTDGTGPLLIGALICVLLSLILISLASNPQ